MSFELFCCLCCTSNINNNNKCLQNDSGEFNEIYEIIVKYFCSELILAYIHSQSSEEKRVLCENCWTHIEDFYNFQQTVIRKKTSLINKQKTLLYIDVGKSPVITVYNDNDTINKRTASLEQLSIQKSPLNIKNQYHLASVNNDGNRSQMILNVNGLVDERNVEDITISSDCSKDDSVPDRNEDTSEYSEESITEKEDDVNEIDVPFNYSKQQYCPFCKELQSKIGRHLLLKHKNEEDVKKALRLPKKSKERLQILENISNKVGIEQNRDEVVSDGFTENIANNILRTKIFPALGDDEITNTIRRDELLIKFGNFLTKKYLEKQHHLICDNLRLLGRFIIEIKKLDPTVNELKNLYKPNLFDNCIKAIRNIANWNESLKKFETPAVAQNLTSLIKMCGKKQRSELITEEREGLRTELEHFFLLWEGRTADADQKETEVLTSQKVIKKVKSPADDMDDLKKLYIYLKAKILTAIEALLHKFCIPSWSQLVKATLVFIQIYNRRKADEIEKIKIENFEDRELITDVITFDILQKASKDSINFIENFERISLRDKFERPISVLLCPMSVKAIELIIKYRAEAALVSHTYIFNKPNSSKRYYRTWPLLKMFSKECGAKIPKSLRGTTLEKHMEVYTSLLNIEEVSVDRFGNISDEHEDILKIIRGNRIPVTEIDSVTKLLIAAIEDDVDEEDIVVGVHSENSDDSSEQTRLTSNSSLKRKRRGTSPYGKKKRAMWTSEETEAVLSIFGDLGSLKSLPSIKECRNAVRRSPALGNRTPRQVKSWIDTQRKYKLD